VHAALADALASAPPGQEVEVLVTLLHRAAVELNKSARTHAAATKGQPEWGHWAGLQNTTRSLVLQASTCRDLVHKLPRET
jgi:hypothetical protein